MDPLLERGVEFLRLLEQAGVVQGQRDSPRQLLEEHEFRFAIMAAGDGPDRRQRAQDAAPSDEGTTTADCNPRSRSLPAARSAGADPWEIDGGTDGNTSGAPVRMTRAGPRGASNSNGCPSTMAGRARSVQATAARSKVPSGATTSAADQSAIEGTIRFTTSARPEALFQGEVNNRPASARSRCETSACLRRVMS